MSYLLDTNVFSEIQRGDRCDEGVRAWWTAREPSEVFLSVLVLGEIRRGVVRLRNRQPDRAASIERWLRSGLQLFAGRVLVVDARVAHLWGTITSARSLPVIDSLLAATAICHDLVLVTRNARDIHDTGVRWLNPFDG